MALAPLLSATVPCQPGPWIGLGASVGADVKSALAAMTRIDDLPSPHARGGGGVRDQ